MLFCGVMWGLRNGTSDCHCPINRVPIYHHCLNLSSLSQSIVIVPIYRHCPNLLSLSQSIILVPLFVIVPIHCRSSSNMTVYEIEGS